MVHDLKGRIMINHTESLPGLLYSITPIKDNTELNRNDIVRICPDKNITKAALILHVTLKSKTCPFGTEPLIKKIMAMPGDIVKATGDQEIEINNEKIPGTKPREKIPPFIFEGTVPANHYLVLTNHPKGFDSRYFGFIEKSYFTDKAYKIF